MREKPIIIEGEKLQELHDLMRLCQRLMDCMGCVLVQGTNKSKCATIAQMIVEKIEKMTR